MKKQKHTLENRYCCFSETNSAEKTGFQMQKNEIRPISITHIIHRWINYLNLNHKHDSSLLQKPKVGSK